MVTRAEGGQSLAIELNKQLQERSRWARFLIGFTGRVLVKEPLYQQIPDDTDEFLPGVAPEMTPVGRTFARLLLLTGIVKKNSTHGTQLNDVLRVNKRRIRKGPETVIFDQNGPVKRK